MIFIEKNTLQACLPLVELIQKASTDKSAAAVHYPETVWQVVI
jgi:hypothetical protein